MPVNGFGLHQRKRQAQDQCGCQLHGVGHANVAWRHMTLLVQGARSDAEQRQNGQRKIPRRDLADTELAPQDQRQTHEPQQQAQPFTGRHSDVASGGCCGCGGRQPHRREHGLQPDEQCHRAGADAELDGRPDTTEIARVHQRPTHGQVQPLPRFAWPRRTGQTEPHGEAKHGERETHRQEGHRRRMWHGKSRHHKPGAPDEHKEPGHPAHPDARSAGRHLSAPWRVSLGAPSGGNRPSTRWSAPQKCR